MSMKRRVQTLAAEFGAEISVSPNDDGGQQIEVAAPEGRRWDEGPGVLIANYGPTWGTAAEAWADLYERMAEGTEPDETI